MPSEPAEAPCPGQSNRPLPRDHVRQLCWRITGRYCHDDAHGWMRGWVKAWRSRQGRCVWRGSALSRRRRSGGRPPFAGANPVGHRSPATYHSCEDHSRSLNATDPHEQLPECGSGRSPGGDDSFGRWFVREPEEARYGTDRADLAGRPRTRPAVAGQPKCVEDLKRNNRRDDRAVHELRARRGRARGA
jgi:hypothetical protein